MKKKHLSPFIGAAVLSAALCTQTKASHSSIDEPRLDPSSKAHMSLPNILSALSAVDTDGFFPPERPKSLRGTWQEYNAESVSKFLSGNMKIVNPHLFNKNLLWEELSEEDKQPVSAISVMFEQKKAMFLSLGLITQEEAEGSWEDLSLDRRSAFSTEHILPSRAGLAECRSVGCGQFNEDQLKHVIEFIISQDNQAIAHTYSKADPDISYEEAFATVTHMRRLGALQTSIAIIDHREEPHLHIKANPAIGYERSGLVFF